LEDRIFVYFTWNRQYCTIDKETGRILTKGEGDDSLKQYDSLVPLRLTAKCSPPSRSISLPLADMRDRPEVMVGILWQSRQNSTVSRDDSHDEAIPGSKLVTRYVVQFDTNRDGHPGPDWRPLFVIVWKAENCESIGFGFPRIWINGHLMRPPSGRNVIYALQPDYSLKQLPLTADEIAHLFSHITSSEKRTDERVASVLQRIERRDPKRVSEFCAERDEEGRFPPNGYWKEKVDPYVKVVEPPQNKAQ
jgi:hypothetical protein